VKISQASEAEVANVTRQLQSSGWAVARGKIDGAPVLILSVQSKRDGIGRERAVRVIERSAGPIYAAADLEITVDELHQLMAEYEIPTPERPGTSWNERTTAGVIHTDGPSLLESEDAAHERLHGPTFKSPPPDQAAMVRIIESSKSADEAAGGLSLTVVELREHMRLRAVEATSADGRAALFTASGHPRLWLRTSAFGAIPVGTIDPAGATRVMLNQGMVLVVRNLEIAADLQAPLAGAPYLARGVLQVSYRFDIKPRRRAQRGATNAG
jgi:hypothetical protein